ncbi:MAG: Gfo/Idh/MocA family oxidoreductase [Synoicihabitans sp.]
MNTPTPFPLDPNSLTRRDALKTLSAAGILSAFGCSPLWGQKTYTGRRLGVALVGLGNYSTNQLAPALQLTQIAELRGIVTGSPEKIPEWQDKYGIKDGNVYSYDNFDEIAKNPEIDLVYVVTPHGLHAEYSIRAAKAGKHVICEKTMARNVTEADAMLAAARKNNVRLAIGYRLHHDPHNLRCMELARTQALGKLEAIKAEFSSKPPAARIQSHWMFKRHLGVAGALYNLGIYPVQAQIYIAGQNPTRVTAQGYNTRPELFTECEETYEWQLEFPNGMTSEGASSSARPGNYYHVTAERGKFGIKNRAYAYSGQEGYINEQPMIVSDVPQQALHMDGVCQSILAKLPLRTPGTMGRRDQVVMDGILESIATGETVQLSKRYL